jgi:phytoene/squalene synthetase
MKALFDDVSFEIGQITTKTYSTSFSHGIRFLDKKLRKHVYSIYGYVRFADEIVDTFHDHDKEVLLNEFEQDTFKALDRGISTNPILNAFQHTVKEFNIEHDLIKTFLNSMRMDLNPVDYSQEKYETYILGSAEVVGLMCLRIFCYGDDKLYNQTKAQAMSLGSAFQKINFLRDLKDDYHTLGRTYFPGVDMSNFNDQVKAEIEKDIEKDFAEGYLGILQLPKSSRFGVYVAYVYYFRLLKKIHKSSAQEILHNRVRIPNQRKYTLFVSSYVKHSFNMI